MWFIKLRIRLKMSCLFLLKFFEENFLLFAKTIFCFFLVITNLNLFFLDGPMNWPHVLYKAQKNGPCTILIVLKIERWFCFVLVLDRDEMTPNKKCNKINYVSYENQCLTLFSKREILRYHIQYWPFNHTQRSLLIIIIHNHTYQKQQFSFSFLFVN